MIFNSLEFAFFLPLVFLLYWFVFNRTQKLQNIFLVAASYVFYGWWDWRFLLLIVFSSCVDYVIGRLMDVSDDWHRKFLLGVSLIVNLGLLGIFKYYNFFIESFASSFSFLGHNIDSARINVILPVGISFYTFQTLSYSIDVFRRKLEPTKDILAFFAFVSFFPQLVAGPIERATNLLPQFQKPRVFNYILGTDGCRQILWGLFKKIVIADNCAIFVNEIFGSYATQSGSTLALGAIFFAFQIYGDFSGYSDIAIGISKLFGFKLMQNFAFPYFSRDIAEFWRRWHISLSTWFRDYLYIPLGGSRVSEYKKIRNVFIIFLVSGFWHGANWTFIVWGFINALFIVPLMMFKLNRNNLKVVAQDKLLPDFREFLQIMVTFSITVLAWIYFRSESVTDANYYVLRMISDLFTINAKTVRYLLSSVWLFIFIMIIIEWLHRDREHGLQLNLKKVTTPVRWVGYLGIILLISFFGATQQEFIYFQF